MNSTLIKLWHCFTVLSGEINSNYMQAISQKTGKSQHKGVLFDTDIQGLQRMNPDDFVDPPMRSSCVVISHTYLFNITIQKILSSAN